MQPQAAGDELGSEAGHVGYTSKHTASGPMPNRVSPILSDMELETFT